MRMIDARLDRCRSLKMRRRFVDCLRLRKMILDVWIAFYPRNVGRAADVSGNLSCPLNQNSVNDVERLVLKPAFAQQN